MKLYRAALLFVIFATPLSACASKQNAKLDDPMFVAAKFCGHEAGMGTPNADIEEFERCKQEMLPVAIDSNRQLAEQQIGSASSSMDDFMTVLGALHSAEQARVENKNRKKQEYQRQIEQDRIDNLEFQMNVLRSRGQL